jgi:hypothetical protein
MSCTLERPKKNPLISFVTSLLLCRYVGEGENRRKQSGAILFDNLERILGPPQVVPPSPVIEARKRKKMEMESQAAAAAAAAATSSSPPIDDDDDIVVLEEIPAKKKPKTNRNSQAAGFQKHSANDESPEIVIDEENDIPSTPSRPKSPSLLIWEPEPEPEPVQVQVKNEAPRKIPVETETEGKKEGSHKAQVDKSKVPTHESSRFSAAVPYLAFSQENENRHPHRRPKSPSLLDPVSEPEPVIWKPKAAPAPEHTQVKTEKLSEEIPIQIKTEKSGAAKTDESILVKPKSEVEEPSKLKSALQNIIPTLILFPFLPDSNEEMAGERDKTGSVNTAPAPGTGATADTRTRSMGIRAPATVFVPSTPIKTERDELNKNGEMDMDKEPDTENIENAPAPVPVKIEKGEESANVDVDTENSPVTVKTEKGKEAGKEDGPTTASLNVDVEVEEVTQMETEDPKAVVEEDANGGESHIRIVIKSDIFEAEAEDE